MVKTIICIKRRPNLTRAEFLDYWTHHHAPLIMELKEALRMVKYTQLHSCDNDVSAGLRRSRGGPEMYDGVGTAWFNSMDDLRTLGQDEVSRQAVIRLLKDEARFIDLSASPFWVVEEHEIF